MGGERKEGNGDKGREGQELERKRKEERRGGERRGKGSGRENRERRERKRRREKGRKKVWKRRREERRKPPRIEGQEFTDLTNLPSTLGFPGGSEGKASACSVGDLGSVLG